MFHRSPFVALTLIFGLLSSGLVGVVHFHRAHNGSEHGSTAVAIHTGCQCSGHTHNVPGESEPLPEIPDCHLCKILSQLAGETPLIGPPPSIAAIQHAAIPLEFTPESASQIHYRGRAPPASEVI